MQARIRNSVSSLSFSAPVRNRPTNNNIDQEQGDINFYVENHFGKKKPQAHDGDPHYIRKSAYKTQRFSWVVNSSRVVYKGYIWCHRLQLLQGLGGRALRVREVIDIDVRTTLTLLAPSKHMAPVMMLFPSSYPLLFLLMLRSVENNVVACWKQCCILLFGILHL